MFDPYRKWLGIPEQFRPPSHYQLLGIQPDERDPDVIRSAVTQRSAFVRNFQRGAQAEAATKLLNEIAAAEACLTDRAKRAAYDAQLKRRAGGSAPPPLPLSPLTTIDPALAAAAAAMPVGGMPAYPAWQPTARRKKVTGGQWAAMAAAAFVGLLVVVVIVVLVANLGQDETSVADEGSGAGPRPSTEIEPTADAPSDEEQGTSPAEPVEDAPGPADNPQPVAASDEPQPAADTPAVTEAPPLKPPFEPLGVTADRLVIWNTHNAEYNDRGALEGEVRLFLERDEIWKSGRIVIPWVANQDLNATVALPDVRFDRVRVNVTKWKTPGSGGLSEIQVFKGSNNVAYGCPASSSVPADPRFSPQKVTDGNVSSRSVGHGYTTLADGLEGWVEVDVSAPRVAEGVTAERIVLHNEHNGQSNDSGTTLCRVALVHQDREIWQDAQVRIPWERGKDTSVTLTPPQVAFDRVRVEIRERKGDSGGLAEIEVFSAGKNIAAGCGAIASSFPQPSLSPGRVTDGITTSLTNDQGYWRLLKGLDGWIEVDLLTRDERTPAMWKQLGEYRCFGQGEWRLGLPWLARCGDATLASLALGELGTGNDAIPPLGLADGWWDLASAADASSQQGMRSRAVWHYQRALFGIPSFHRARVLKTIDEALPTLADRKYLYMMREESVSGVAGELSLRPPNIVVGGVYYPYALWMYPPPSASAQAAFRVKEPARRLVGGVGIDDRYPEASSPLTFRVFGEGKVLWSSQPLRKGGARETFAVDISGVSVLELVVDCAGSNTAAGAVWLDPRVE